MESADLKSVRRKIERAEHHFDDIKSALKLVLGTETDNHAVIIKNDYERKQMIITLPKVTPIKPSVPLIVGDCIHNLRSALDHLVFQLARKNGASAEAAQKTFFPICLTQEDFESRVKKLVKPFISDKALAEIKRSQPYSAYDVPEGSDIWVLHKLDIIDKHRLLLVAKQQYALTHFRVTVPTGESFEKVFTETKWKPMEDGAEIIRFDFSRAIKAPGKVHVQMQAVSTVQFVETDSACDGLVVDDAINQITAMVKATVRDFGVMFFGE
jgi:hypothetical protein